MLDNKLQFQSFVNTHSLVCPSDIRVVVLQKVRHFVHRAGFCQPLAPSTGRSGEQQLRGTLLFSKRRYRAEKQRCRFYFKLKASYWLSFQTFQSKCSNVWAIVLFFFQNVKCGGTHWTYSEVQSTAGIFLKCCQLIALIYELLNKWLNSKHYIHDPSIPGTLGWRVKSPWHITTWIYQHKIIRPSSWETLSSLDQKTLVST